MNKVKEVEEKLKYIIQAHKLEDRITVDMVKSWIWHDDKDSARDAINAYQKKYLIFFARVRSIDKLNEVMQAFTDAWNCFPHKSLGGISPEQVVERELKKHPEFKKDHEHKPKIIVGGHEMNWDDYWKMLKEMERRQIPFKDWAEKDLLQKYEKYLKDSFGKKTVDKHMQVADIFFQRAMRIGFVEFDQIRPDFIQKEFPKWWQTHVLMSGLSEKEVLSSLRKLFEFIEVIYNRDIKKFGFV